MKPYGREELRFFGRITAGCTHELKNVLAVIKESSGLMEDLMDLAREAPIPHREKFENALAAIKKQVRRGVEITDHLNRFAHSPDAELADIGLNETVRQMAALVQRFARLKKVTLETEALEQDVTVSTCPVRLLMAFFAVVECCLSAVPEGSRVVVRPQRNGPKCALNVICQGDFPDPSALARNISASDRWEEAEQILSSLGGVVEPAAAGPGIRLLLPQKPN